MIFSVLLESPLAGQGPPAPERRVAGQGVPPAAARQLLVACDGLVGHVHLSRPKSPTMTCAGVEAAAELDLGSEQYESACLSQFGGPPPGRISSVEASCTALDHSFETDVQVCCPNPCKDLDPTACRGLAVCAWGRCQHSKGSLTCGDLAGQEQCGRYPPCQWQTARCVAGGILPFECNDLKGADCANHSECVRQTACRRRSGSLTCDDLDQNQCSRYGGHCNWKNGSCRKKLAAGPFECRDLNAQDCSAESECALEDQCRRQSGSLTCGDLSLDECGRYSKWCNSKEQACIKDPAKPLASFTCQNLQKNDCFGEPECSWAERCFHRQE